MLFLKLIKYIKCVVNNGQKLSKGKSKMDNPEKLATQDTQNEEKQNKNTTQYVFCPWIDMSLH